MEKDDLYLILARIKLLMNKYEKEDRKTIDLKELKIILNNIEIPSKYLIAEGFDNIYNKTKNEK